MHHIRSLYWNNVDRKIQQAQGEVCAALAIPLQQDNRDGVPHGQWLDECLQEIAEGDAILFLDIDCIPLDKAIVEEAFRAAEQGAIFGVAQVANHLDPHFIYAAPAFLCLTKQTWLALDSPSLKAEGSFDVGGKLTFLARQRGYEVKLLDPSFTLLPKWRMADKGCFGIGTFYAGRVFHLFEARHGTGRRRAFLEVAECITRQQPVDYLRLYRTMHSLPARLADAAGYLHSQARKIQRYVAGFFR